MEINISSSLQDFSAPEIRYEENHQQLSQAYPITYFDAYSGETNNVEISGGEWIDYFGTGWFIIGEGSSLQITTEINKSMQERYELDLSGQFCPTQRI